MNARKKVLIIGIDGCRPGALRVADTPNLDALIGEGVVSYQAQTCEFTVSAPGWSSMLTGVWPAKHGVTDNTFDGAQFDRFPHFFQRLKEASEDVVAASIVSWAPINQIILSHSDVSEECDLDAEVAQSASELLISRDPDVLFVHFDDVDNAGHAHGYGPDSTEYLGAINRIDAHIGSVLTAVRQRKTYHSEDWLVLVSTDHGGIGRSHGEDLPELRTIFVIAANLDAAKRSMDTAPEIVDIPPTVFRHLDLTPMPSWGWDGTAIGSWRDWL